MILISIHHLVAIHCDAQIYQLTQIHADFSIAEHVWNHRIDNYMEDLINFGITPLAPLTLGLQRQAVTFIIFRLFLSWEGQSAPDSLPPWLSTCIYYLH